MCTLQCMKKDCLFDEFLYFHSKQLRSCWDGQFLNHTVPGQASRRQFTSIKCPVTDNLLFLTERKMEIFVHKRLPDARVDLGIAAYESDTLTTELLCPVP